MEAFKGIQRGPGVNAKANGRAGEGAKRRYGDTAMVGRKTRRADRAVCIFLLTAPVVSRGSTRAMPRIRAHSAFTSVQMIDQSTRPERLKTGANTFKMQPHA
jgi:hypothetical protein